MWIFCIFGALAPDISTVKNQARDDAAYNGNAKQLSATKIASVAAAYLHDTQHDW